ncbi:Six-hairpin glycosidase [Marasmius fiardii PR-910]|nr:Six-hairpin glycosidase [Marasmius fiardii PR-910]
MFYTAIVLFLIAHLISVDINVELRKNAFPFDPGFDIESVASLAETLPTHSWEYGTAAEALLELYNPDASVFGRKPFPVPTLDRNDTPSLAFAESRITIGTPPNVFADGDGAVGDPASLGVAAVMLGKSDPKYVLAIDSEMSYLANQVPRWWNGAISHRADVAELWADWMYMLPPFMAYYAVDSHDADLLKEAVNQCGLQREVLRANVSEYAPYNGVWEHIVGPQSADHGLWSTGNAWAVGGMSRVLATVKKAPRSLTKGWGKEAIANLTFWIKEIIDGALASPPDDGLLRNYLNDTETAHGFGEISGTSMIASVVYRMTVLDPGTFGEKYISWADDAMKTIAGKDAAGVPHVSRNGAVTPAVNPLGWQDTEPWTSGSPEGNNFVVLMYVAWRDCVLAGICQRYY